MIESFLNLGLNDEKKLNSTNNEKSKNNEELNKTIEENQIINIEEPVFNEVRNIEIIDGKKVMITKTISPISNQQALLTIKKEIISKGLKWKYFLEFYYYPFWRLLC